jgi:hypothetical protein
MFFVLFFVWFFSSSVCLLKSHYDTQKQKNCWKHLHFVILSFFSKNTHFSFSLSHTHSLSLSVLQLLHSHTHTHVLIMLPQEMEDTSFVLGLYFVRSHTFKTNIIFLTFTYIFKISSLNIYLYKYFSPFLLVPTKTIHFDLMQQLFLLWAPETQMAFKLRTDFVNTTAHL